MKKKTVSGLILIGALSLQACKKETFTPKENSKTEDGNQISSNSKKTVKVGELTATLPDGYSEKIFKYSKEDWETKVRGNLKSGNDNVEFDLDQLINNIIEPSLDKYPGISITDGIEASEELAFTKEEIIEISDDFGGVSEEIIIKNEEIIKDYYETLAISDVVNKVSKLIATPVEKGAYSYKPSSIGNGKLNVKELAVLASKPTLAQAYKSASNDAPIVERGYTGFNQNGWRNTGDALRHIMWNYLICKYGGAVETNATTLINFTRDITNAHEYNPSSCTTQEDQDADHQMDYHNNLYGRNLFQKNNWYYKPNWYSKSKLGCPDTYVMGNKVWWDQVCLGLALKRTTKSTILSAPVDKIVYIVD